jgi:hypothetical protein
MGDISGAFGGSKATKGHELLSNLSLSVSASRVYFLDLILNVYENCSRRNY